MTIHFHCECGQKLKAASDSIGKTFDCPVCGVRVTVPATDEHERASRPLAAYSASQNAAQAVGPVSQHGRPIEAGPIEAGPRVDEDSAIISSTTDSPTKKELAESDTKEFATGDTKVFNAPDEPARAKPVEKNAPERRSDKERRKPPAATERAHVNTGYERLNPVYERVHAASPRHEQNGHDELPESPTGGSSAETARDLYRLVRKMKKGSKNEVVAKPKKKKRAASDDEGFDYGALVVELGRTVVPGIAGVALACFLAYWLASSAMSAGRGLPELGDVAGTVTLDGAPLAGATVTFIPAPEDEDAASRIASSVGMTDKAGNYELMYVEDVSGAAVGPHQVAINLPLPNGAEKLPRRYNSASELTFEVEPGNNTADFKLTSK